MKDGVGKVKEVDTSLQNLLYLSLNRRFYLLCRRVKAFLNPKML